MAVPTLNSLEKRLDAVIHELITYALPERQGVNVRVVRQAPPPLVDPEAEKRLKARRQPPQVQPQPTQPLQPSPYPQPPQYSQPSQYPTVPPKTGYES